MSRRGAVAALLLAALALTGCAGGALPSPDLESRVEVDTPALRAAKKELGVEPCPAPRGNGGSAASDLPDLTLACLGGGRDVTLSTLRGPAVVSLWASWCTSCPDELPLFQRLHDEAGRRLSVVGVDYQDTQPGKAMALLELTKATFPQLADPGGALADHYRVSGLPGVLLVDAEGRVTFKLQRIDSYAQLLGLVEDHTGVRVRAG